MCAFERSEKGMEFIMKEIDENTSKYGEFITSYFAWLPLTKQKDRAEELEKRSKNGEKMRENEK